MIITSGKVLICIGVAALALVACSSTSGEDETATEATTAGAGGSAGGTGGTDDSEDTVIEIEVEEVEPYDCGKLQFFGIEPDATLKMVFNDNKYVVYEPAELTLRVGDIMAFYPAGEGTNLTSGVLPDPDGKFYTEPGYAGCLKFNTVGTYPYFSYHVQYPIKGIIYVQ